MSFSLVIQLINVKHIANLIYIVLKGQITSYLIFHVCNRSSLKEKNKRTNIYATKDVSEKTPSNPTAWPFTNILQVSCEARRNHMFHSIRLQRLVLLGTERLELRIHFSFSSKIIEMLHRNV